MGKTAAAKAIEALVRLKKPHLLKRTGGINQSQFASEAKLEQPTLGRILKGESESPSSKVLEKLAKYFDVSIDQVMGRTDESGVRLVTGIPIVGTTQGGPDRQWEELGYAAGYGEEYLDIMSKDSSAYALRVRGTSMAPRIREGEVILVEPQSRAEAGDDVVVRTTDGQVMVKVLVSIRNDEVTLDSISQDFNRIVLAMSKVQFIHPVMGHFPSRSVLKRKSVTSP